MKVTLNAEAGARFVIGSCFYNYISYFSLTLWQGDIALADSNKNHECAATTIKNKQGTLTLMRFRRFSGKSRETCPFAAESGEK